MKVQTVNFSVTHSRLRIATSGINMTPARCSTCQSDCK
jgi:hypothetical protein